MSNVETPKGQEGRFLLDGNATLLKKRIKGMDIKLWQDLRSDMIMSAQFDNIRNHSQFKDALWYVAEIIDEFKGDKLASWITCEFGSNTDTRYLMDLLSNMKIDQDDLDIFLTKEGLEDLQTDLAIMIRAQERAAGIAQKYN